MPLSQIADSGHAVRSAASPATRAGAHQGLVYLLDHEYTQKGLPWGRLKNGDAVRAVLLREVANRLDCEVVLALADVHESWSCEDDWGYDGYGYGRRSRRWQYGDYDDEDEDGDDHDDADDGGDVAGSEDYTLIELFDSSIELRHWLAPSGKRVQAISGEVVRRRGLLHEGECRIRPVRLRARRLHRQRRQHGRSLVPPRRRDAVAPRPDFRDPCKGITGVGDPGDREAADAQLERRREREGRRSAPGRKLALAPLDRHALAIAHRKDFIKEHPSGDQHGKQTQLKIRTRAIATARKGAG